MLRLVDLLERWAAADGEDVTVVFERPPSPPIRSTVIEVAHAPRAKPTRPTTRSSGACEPIPSRPTCVVVTSDRWLSDRASAAGASVDGRQRCSARVLKNE